MMVMSLGGAVVMLFVMVVTLMVPCGGEGRVESMVFGGIVRVVADYQVGGQVR